MLISLGETKRFPLGPSMITLRASEECECERITGDHVKITMRSLPGVVIHLDKVPYDPRLGRYYFKDRSIIFGNLPRLRDDISQKFGFDPNIEFEINQPQENNDSDWYRMRWRDLDNPEVKGMDVWLYQQESANGWMLRVMAAKLTEEESSHIRNIITNIRE